MAGRVSYAEVLLLWARRFAGRTPLAAGGSLALFERPSQIKMRVGMLLEESFRVETSCPRWWRLAVCGGTALAVLGISLFTLRPAAAGDPARQKESPPVATGQDQAKTKPATEPGDSVEVRDPERQAALRSEGLRDPGPRPPEE